MMFEFCEECVAESVNIACEHVLVDGRSLAWTDPGKDNEHKFECMRRSTHVWYLAVRLCVLTVNSQPCIVEMCT